MQQTESEYKSPLVQAIEARARKTHLFRVSELLGLPEPQVHHVEIRVATKAEEDTAVVAAHAYVSKKAGQSDAKNDPDLLTDAKSCHILHTVCREAGSPELGGAFLGPEWMTKHLTTDHIAALLNLYNEVRKKEGPAPKVLDDETIDTMLRLCAVAVEEDEAIPQWVVAAWNREALSEAIIVAAVKLDVARKEADAANAALDKMRAELATMREAMKAAGVELPAEPPGETT